MTPDKAALREGCNRRLAPQYATSAMKQSGMTLVEVVIASVIFAMIMLAVVTSMRMFGQTYDRLQITVADTEVRREVSRFLRGALEDLVLSSGHFDGDGRRLVWMAPIDRVGSAGGLQYLRLTASGKQLLLSFAPYDRLAEADEEPAWSSGVETAVLLRDLQSFAVTYKSAPDDSWESELGDAEDVGAPWGVRLMITTSSGAWPPITVTFSQRRSI